MEYYELLIQESLLKYKFVMIDYEKLVEFAAENNENKARFIKTLDFNNFKKTIQDLCDRKILLPYGKDSYNGLVKNYRVAHNIIKNKRNTEVTAKIMSYKFPNISFYTRNHEEFCKDKKTIDSLYNYYIKEDKPLLTANELGVLIFNDEKAFEQTEKGKNNISSKPVENKVNVGYALQVVNKLKLNMYNHFNAYITIEPFFYHLNKSFFEKDVRKILITENKDTYYSFYRSDISNQYDMIIYGEGNKIISSFSVANDYGILTSDEIFYFGDIDPVGFSIYNNLKKVYNDYNICLDKQYYISLIESYYYKECPKIKNTKIASYMVIALSVIEEEFTPQQSEFLKRIFTEKRYIPQEAISIIWL